MQYFVTLGTDHWTAKNNAQKQAKELFQQKSNTLINSDHDVLHFKTQLILLVREINETNPRAKDLQIHTIKPSDPQIKAIFHIPSVSSLVVYPVKHTL